MKPIDFELNTGDAPVSVFPCKIIKPGGVSKEIPSDLVQSQALERQERRRISWQRQARILKALDASEIYPDE